MVLLQLLCHVTVSVVTLGCEWSCEEELELCNRRFSLFVDFYCVCWRCFDEVAGWGVVVLRWFHDGIWGAKAGDRGFQRERGKWARGREGKEEEGVGRGGGAPAHAAERSGSAGARASGGGGRSRGGGAGGEGGRGVAGEGGPAEAERDAAEILPLDLRGARFENAGRREGQLPGLRILRWVVVPRQQRIRNVQNHLRPREAAVQAHQWDDHGKSSHSHVPASKPTYHRAQKPKNILTNSAHKSLALRLKTTQLLMNKSAKKCTNDRASWVTTMDMLSDRAFFSKNSQLS
jgi:hypothetical protein